jgi:hypothetical protein
MKPIKMKPKPTQRPQVQLVVLPDTPNTRRLAAACKAIQTRYFTQTAQAA